MKIVKPLLAICLIVGFFVMLWVLSYENPKHSICIIYAYKTLKPIAFGWKQGTGFVIASNTIMTCAHVVSFVTPSFQLALADSILCIFDNDTFRVAKCSIDVKKDIAWLTVHNLNRRPLPYRPIILRSTLVTQTGTKLYLMGYPHARWHTLSLRVFEPAPQRNKIIAYTDTHISLAGASGSPIFYRRWVIGILQEQGYRYYSARRFIVFTLLQSLH